MERNPGLDARERWTAVAIGVGAVAFAMLVAWPLEVLSGAGWGAVAFDGVVFGLPLAAAGVTVYVDRRQSAKLAARCPRCGAGEQAGAATCASCGYDLVERPRYVCSERHEVTREPGVCDCGRRLQPVPPPVGDARRVVTTLKAGAWMLAFLLGVGFFLQLAGA